MYIIGMSSLLLDVSNVFKIKIKICIISLTDMRIVASTANVLEEPPQVLFLSIFTSEH